MSILHLKVNLDAIVRPSRVAATVSSEMVDFCFIGFRQADLSQAPSNEDSKFHLKGNLSATERKALYENWLLSKAFQDLMRGVRLSLEEAHVVLQMLNGPQKVQTTSTFVQFLAPFRKKANDAQFPQLLDDVNRWSQQKLAFADAYLSMQKARNCFEHSDGVVQERHVDTSTKEMELRFPRMKIFFLKEGQEIEIAPGTVVDGDADDHGQVSVLMKIEVRVRTYKIGERIRISLSDFNEIAFACYHFGIELSTGLREALAKYQFERMPHNHPDGSIPSWAAQPEHIKSVFREAVNSSAASTPPPPTAR